MTSPTSSPAAARAADLAAAAGSLDALREAMAGFEGSPLRETATNLVFADGAPGNLRVDYVLPSTSLRILDAGVFWPTSGDPLFRLVGTFPFPTSDHLLVWVDVRLPHHP